MYFLLKACAYRRNYIRLGSAIGRKNINLICIVTNRHKPENFEKYIKDQFKTKLRVAPTIQFESNESINQ